MHAVEEGEETEEEDLEQAPSLSLFSALASIHFVLTEANTFIPECARADELVARLTDLVSQAEQQGTRSGGQDVAPTVSSTATAAAAASPSSVSTSSSTASAPSVVSVASVVSDRTQAYVASKLHELRTELATLYPTTETMQHKVNEELDRALVGLAENEEMNVAIDEAVDQAREKVREKQLQVWQ